MDASYSDVPTPNGILYAGETPEDVLRQNSPEERLKRIEANFQKILSKEKAKKTKGRRAIIKYKGKAILEYKREEYKMPKGTTYANLSEKIYEHCQLVGGSISCKVAHEGITGRRYEDNLVGNWNWLYQHIRSANRWASRNGLPKLFECHRDSIERLI